MNLKSIYPYGLNRSKYEIMKFINKYERISLFRLGKDIGLVGDIGNIIDKRSFRTRMYMNLEDGDYVETYQTQLPLLIIRKHRYKKLSWSRVGKFYQDIQGDVAIIKMRYPYGYVKKTNNFFYTLLEHFCRYDIIDKYVVPKIDGKYKFYIPDRKINIPKETDLESKFAQPYIISNEIRFKFVRKMPKEVIVWD